MAAFGVTDFDDLNRLVGYTHSEPFEDYFAPMKLTDAQKRERIRIAERFEELFIYTLSMLFYSYPAIDPGAVEDLKNSYLNELVELGIISSAANDIVNRDYELHASTFAANLIASTQSHADDPYYYSGDRAKYVAEDQANFVGDMSDFDDAIAAGMTHKTWETAGDNRVRNSHAEVEGLTIPIDEPFELQGGEMMYPHDESMGVDENELIGCRCTLSFS